MQTNSEAVKEFTEGAYGKTCPETPQLLNKDDAHFIIRMVISELDELAVTVCGDRKETDKFMQEALDTRDKCKNFEYNGDVERIGAQADSMVDAWYYMLNIAAKHGINLSKLFDVIHQANMAKRDPQTGKFIKRESDGKIMKPVGWKPADIDAEIRNQMEKGSWSRTQ